MNKLNFLGSFLLFVVISLFSIGQVAVGQWRDHLPYSYGERIVLAGNHVYLVTNVGLLKYNKQSGETEKMTKINGLSDSGVKSATYSQEYGYVILGYSNGNIDILKGNQIINISDIKRKSMSGDKAIYSIYTLGDNAYLGCGFGIVVIDLERFEVKETWFIGNNGTNVKINDLEISNSKVYAATDIGVFVGDMTLNLVDFSNWEIITEQNLPNSLQWMPGQSFNTLKTINNKLVVNFRNPAFSNQDTLLVFDGNTWSYFDISIVDTENLSGNDEYLLLSSGYWFRIYDKNLELVRHIWQYDFPDGAQNPRPSHAQIENGQELWIADKRFGIVINPTTWKYSYVGINGPSTFSVFDMSTKDSEIIVVAGGMNLSWGPLWRNASFFKLENNIWNNYDGSTIAQLSDYRDLVRVKYDPFDNNRYFIGSWIYGLLEFRNNQLFKVHNSSNSTLATVTGVDYTRIGGLAFDQNENLWVTNSLASPQIHVLSKDGNWSSIDYSNTIGGINLGQIIVTKDNIKWVILPQGVGLFVFDENGTPSDKSDDKYKKLNVIDENGQIISNEVFSIAEDKNGYIWVGTNKGVVVYYNPENVFETSNFSGRQVKIPRNDGTDNADILLGNEIVTSIVVDGANRKWFGTQTGGVYYTSPDGIEEIHHFTKDNSPLLSNTVVCTDIIPNTGEVFFGTSAGIISYRSTATEGADDYVGVYVFPNPVKHDYRGPITITGLVAGSFVKITDISGNLVFETRSDGGQAVWYGEDINGRRVNSGVYLVFSSNETGSKTDVTKILFIN